MCDWSRYLRTTASGRVIIHNVGSHCHFVFVVAQHSYFSALNGNPGFVTLKLSPAKTGLGAATETIATLRDIVGSASVHNVVQSASGLYVDVPAEVC